MEEVRAGEKLYELCVILKDIPGASAKVTKVLAEANVNIRSESVFRLPNQEELGSWTAFIDVSKSTQSLSEVEAKLRKLDMVVDVKFKEPKPAPFEMFHFPLLHGKTRAVIMPIGTFWALIDQLERILKPSGLAAVHYETGKKVGIHTATRLKERCGLEGTDLILAFTQALMATGWGIAEVRDLDFNLPSATIIIKESFEAVAWRRKPDKVCHWTRGFVSGFMNIALSKHVDVVEAKCLATGDEYCEFKIQ